MAVQINKVDVWAGDIADSPGGLSATLEALAEAGASLEFVISRRRPEKPGRGVVFLAPVRGPKAIRAARAAGLSKAARMFSLRLEGPDKPGFGAKISEAIAEVDINMRGLSAAAIGRKCVVYFAFDTDADAKKASRVLKKKFGGK